MAHRHGVLAVSVAAFGATMLARLVLSPVVPRIIAEFNVTKGAIGIALSGMWGAYALMQFPSGVLGERFGERRIVLVALGLTAAACLLVAVAPTFLVFAGVVVLLGAGAGLYFSPATSLLTRLFTETGGALSVHAAGASIGGLIAPVVAALLAVRFGWRAALIAGAAVAGTILPVYAWQVRAGEAIHPDVSLRERASLPVLQELLTRPGIAYTTGIAVTTVFAWQALASFFPTFLVEYRGYSETRAGLVFSAVFVLSTVALPIIGLLSDRFSRDTVLGSALVTAAVGLGAIVAIPGQVGVIIGGTCIGIGFSWGGVVQSRFMDRFAPREQGTGFGLVRTVYMLIGATGSAVTGTLAGVAGWPVAYGTVAVLLSLSAISLLINRTFGLEL